MDTVVWVNGRLVGEDESTLSALDHGITVGDGAFETCTVVGGNVFALTRHLARLRRSLTGLGLDLSDDDEARCVAGLRDVIAATGPIDGRLRITVTSGIGPLGSGRTTSPFTVVVAAQASVMTPEGRAARSPWTRNERSAVVGLKTTSYAENVVALADAVARGGDEALLANTRGELCEGTGSNVFVEIDGELLTPPLDSGCLAGITRELLLEWGREAGLPVREAVLPFSVLDRVTVGEAHLVVTSSGRNVQPVTWLDGVAVAAGPVSLAARELFDRLHRERNDP
ncbi:aminotransferase class IV [Xylanimonas cellulosilytica DSM 15894]|uniref:Aminotransferase class IV n=1 Tax=Xylanimonas cellulosilytica (strain DSM 15894 / JCM 12276 / CECT 5975 / KCTC 9989 / LMG 20990 / NBRC 107835 / XIL07) TaxID=446471 RepID=D1BT52_XYLCX|nr:aminotransferase class IV [Xylanimonas cellulosilytica]ACZ30894.1 aminotransferase class IV [Xylanimonas cellulosilytica DSM 15894]